MLFIKMLQSLVDQRQERLGALTGPRLGFPPDTSARLIIGASQMHPGTWIEGRCGETVGEAPIAETLAVS